MNGTPHGAFAVAPRNRLRTTHDALQAREEAGFQVNLKSIIGTTTTSSNAFATSSDHDIFAYCAGPAVILSRVDENFNITQRLHRARPNAAPVNATQSFYSTYTPPTTPSKTRYNSPWKESTYASGSPAIGEYSQDSPKIGKAANWNREATCLSLSRNGRFLAVGEVCDQCPLVLMEG